MTEEDNNILYFKNKEQDAGNELRKTFKADDTQALNLDILLNTCIYQNDFSQLYKYLFSEVEFRGGLTSFAETIKINPAELRKFFHSEGQPDLSILSKILNGLNFKLCIMKQ